MKNLQKIRKEKNITQTQIENDLGITQKKISDYENNNSQPNLETLIKLADYFHTTVDYLIGRETKQHLDLTKIRLAEREIIESLKMLEDRELYFIKGYIDKLMESRK